MTGEGNWGNIFATRTGCADFSHEVLGVGWNRKGFKSIGGYLYRGDQEFKIYEEEELFKLLELPFTEPEYRISGNFQECLRKQKANTL